MVQFNHVSQVIYDLKHRYGESIVLKRLGVKTPNLDTGVITAASDTTLTVNKAIILPGKAASKYSKFDKPFNYGGFYDVNQRVIIIDAKDCLTLVPALDDQVVWRSKTYEIKEINEFDNAAAYVLTIVEYKGQRS